MTMTKMMTLMTMTTISISFHSYASSTFWENCLRTMIVVALPPYVAWGLIKKSCLTSIGIPIAEIRQSDNHLISTIGFPILVRWHFYTESGARSSWYWLWNKRTICLSWGKIGLPAQWAPSFSGNPQQNRPELCVCHWGLHLVLNLHMYCINILVKITSYFEMYFVLFGNKATTTRISTTCNIAVWRKDEKILIHFSCSLFTILHTEG